MRGDGAAGHRSKWALAASVILACGSSPPPIEQTECDGGVCEPDCGSLSTCEDGCADLDTDVQNCGQCGNICTAPPGVAPVCSAGVCIDDAPRVVSVSPANGATEVPISSNVTIELSEPVTTSLIWFEAICDLSDDKNIGGFDVSGDATTWILTPRKPFRYGETCNATIFADLVADLDETDPPDGLEEDFHFSFSTLVPVFLESFDSGSMPDGWTLIDGDGLTPHADVAFVDDAWIVTGGPNNDWALSTSHYDPPGQADDWLITPQIALAANNVLRFRGRSDDGDSPDSYEVRISTTTPDKAGFLAHSPLLTVTDERSNWAPHDVDLAAAGYQNQSVYIAFRNITASGYTLRIDDIVVE